MTYFRSKFDEEFLFLCKEQTPKGGQIRLDKENPNFFIVEKNKNSNQSDYVKVIPLLQFNKLSSSNIDDKNIEDKMMLCEDKSDTIVSATYDENGTDMAAPDFVCDVNISNLTGDLTSDDEDE